MTGRYTLLFKVSSMVSISFLSVFIEGLLSSSFLACLMWPRLSYLSSSSVSGFFVIVDGDGSVGTCVADGCGGVDKAIE